MQRIKSIARKFVRDEDGATMVEYGLLLALIAVVCIFAITAIGGNLNTKFNKTAKCIETPNDASCK